MSTELEKMVLEYPEGANGIAWNYGQLSWNPNITWKFIQAHPELHQRTTVGSSQSLQPTRLKGWKYKKVAHNPNVPWETIISDERIWSKYFSVPFSELGNSADVPRRSRSRHFVNNQWLNRQGDRIPTPTKWIDLSEIVPFDVVLENLHLPWVWDAFSRNSSVNDKVVLTNMKLPWDWNAMSHCLSWKFFELYPKPPVNSKPIINQSLARLEWASLYPSIAFVPSNVPNDNLEWNYYLMTTNPNLTIEFIEKHLIYIDVWHLSSNPVITLDFVLKHVHKNWCWAELSKHKNITWDMYKNNPSLHWYWPRIQRNPNVTLDIIKNNPHLNWSKRDLSYNPNITLEFMKSDFVFDVFPICECEIGLDQEEIERNKSPCYCNDWNFSKLSSNWFGWTRKQHEYTILMQLVVSCKIMANLPPYLLMEILEDEANFTYYELYNMIF